MRDRLLRYVARVPGMPDVLGPIAHHIAGVTKLPLGVRDAIGEACATHLAIPVYVRSFSVRVGGADIIMAARPYVSLVGLAYYRGLNGFEPSTIAVFAALARQAQVIVDVGANAGIFALLAARVQPRARILAFEPHPVVAMSLAKSVALAGASGVEVFPIALGTETGYTKLYTSISDSLTSLDGARVESSVAVTVPITTLDAISKARGVSGIGLVKVDVEGWELPVFQGAAATLARDRPVVIFEALADAPAAAIDDFFARLGYQILVITPPGLQPVALASSSGAGAAPERNFVAVPVERVASVRALADAALAGDQAVGENAPDVERSQAAHT